MACHPLFCGTRLDKGPITSLQSLTHKPLTKSGATAEASHAPDSSRKKKRGKAGDTFLYLVTQWRSSLNKFVWSFPSARGLCVGRGSRGALRAPRRVPAPAPLSRARPRPGGSAAAASGPAPGEKASQSQREGRMFQSMS